MFLKNVYYRLVRKFFQKAAKRMCSDCKDFLKEGSEILDLGCGSGVVGQEFAKFFKAKITGIDIKDCRVEKIPFQVFDGFHIPFPDKSFDCVLINYVLHHAKDPAFLLKETKRVSRDKIIIFEDLPEGFLAKAYCALHQFSYNLFLGNSLGRSHFKTRSGWEKLFGDLQLEILTKKRVFTPLGHIDLSKRVLYILKK